MQGCDTIQEVDGQPATRQDVPAKKNIVWTFKGGKTHDLYVDVEAWQAESDLEVRHVNPGQADLMDKPAGDGNEAELLDESWADATALSPGVDLREDTDAGTSAQRRNIDFKGGAMLNDVIDRLANCNLGPSGFFVIAHRGS